MSDVGNLLSAASSLVASLNRVLGSVEPGETLRPKTDSVSQFCVGKYCIIRGRLSGVHAGIVQAIDSDSVVLKDSRRIWKYRTAGSGMTLSDVALEGLDDAGSKVSPVVPDLMIPIADVGEVIPVSTVSESSIRGAVDAKRNS